MILATLLLGLGTLAEPAALSAPVARPQETGSARAHPRAIRAIGAWLREYRRGKWDLGNDRDQGSKSFLHRQRLVPPDYLETLTHEHEIDILCGLAAADGSAAATRAVLDVAAVGLDEGIDYSHTMVPSLVRGIGERHLATMRHPAALDVLVAAAKGESGGPPTDAAAVQAAALHALGAAQDPRHEDLLVTTLKTGTPPIRRAAARALAVLGQPSTIAPLGTRLATEDDGTVLIQLVRTLDALLQGRVAAPAVAGAMQAAVFAAAKALGRVRSWRADLVIVEFLAKYRHAHSIPYLIAVLERHALAPGTSPSEEHSGRLRFRTHEVLVELTGARHGIDEPERWRSFWDGVSESFELPKARTDDAAEGRTVSTGFFSIPVQGRRVVFILDASFSMGQPMPSRTSQAPPGAAPERGPVPTRLQVAVRELLGAVTPLPADTLFNVICYEDDVEAWSKRLLPATDRNKERLVEWLDEQQPRGNTNIYDALTQALELKTLVYGQRYGSHIDEIFLLSDGVPNRGAVTDPESIVENIAETNRYSVVRVNTVFIGRDDDPLDKKQVGRRLMQSLAERNGGLFVAP